MHPHNTRFLLGASVALACLAAVAQDETPKAMLAIVGDADRLNVGQGAFCESRTEVPSPSGKQLRIPANKETYFYIQSRIRTQLAIYTCEGDFSFMPSPGLLHVVRYAMSDDRCTLEMYHTEPGGTPKPMPFKQEQARVCLTK